MDRNEFTICFNFLCLPEIYSHKGPVMPGFNATLHSMGFQAVRPFVHVPGFAKIFKKTLITHKMGR